MTNAQAVTATVTVTLNTTTNNLEAKVDYSDTDTNGKAKFVNTYKTEPFKANTKDLFKVTKVLAGRNWNDTDTFTFTLSCVDNAPMPALSNRTVSVNKENQTAAFGETIRWYSTPQKITFTSSARTPVPLRASPTTPPVIRSW